MRRAGLRWRLDPVSGRLTDSHAAVVAEPGTGPRRLLRSADGALLHRVRAAATRRSRLPPAHRRGPVAAGVVMHATPF